MGLHLRRPSTQNSAWHTGGARGTPAPAPGASVRGPWQAWVQGLAGVG